MRTTGLCYLGRHIKTGHYILLPFGRDGLIFVLIGPIVTMSQSEMESGGILQILSYLKKTPNVKCNVLPPSENIPKDELLKIKRNHLLIEIALDENMSELIRIVPLHGERGWQFGMNKEEMQVFQLPMTNESFLAHLNKAFEIAS